MNATRTQRRFKLKSLLGRLPTALDDARRNLACTASDQRMVVMRHPGKHASMWRDFARWVRRCVPQLHERLEFRHVLSQPRRLDRVSACIGWIHDTLELWSPQSYQLACRHLELFRAAGIQCVNPMDQMARVGKLVGSEAMRSAGVRTPQCVWLPAPWRHDPGQRDCEALGLKFPVLIREQRGHGQPSLLFNGPEELRAAELQGFRQPILVEFIDTRSEGCYRKYRYVVAGDVGTPRHMITDRQWDVRPHRRVHQQQFCREEAEFVSQPISPSEHRKFQAAKCALGMDVVGFDYSYTHDGELVIWEANPCLDMNYPRHARGGLHAAVERTFAAVARCYLSAAGVPVPDIVTETLGDVASYDGTDQTGSGQAAA